MNIARPLSRRFWRGQVEGQVLKGDRRRAGGCIDPVAGRRGVGAALLGRIVGAQAHLPARRRQSAHDAAPAVVATDTGC
jgi:hypothetical protein